VSLYVFTWLYRIKCASACSSCEDCWPWPIRCYRLELLRQSCAAEDLGLPSDRTWCWETSLCFRRILYS